MLEMFGSNRFRVGTTSRVIAVLQYHIKGAQFVAYLLIYVPQVYFYVIRSILTVLHCFFTYLSVIKKIYNFIVQHTFIM